jgi:L-rhamnose-H+ transport protein
VADSTFAGIGLVLLGGLFQGSFMAPSKAIRGWAWENYWLIFAVTAYLVCPWLLAVFTIPRLAEVYAGAGLRPILAAVLFGSGWGAGAVTFGIGVDALGLSLGFAIILGMAATAGTLVPLLLQSSGNLSPGFALAIAVCLLLMLAGVAVSSFAGAWRESKEGRRNYARGVAICVASGLLSACGNLGFAFGADLPARARQMGVSESAAQSALWTLLTLPLFACNAGYALLLLRRNETFRRFRTPQSGRSFLLAVSMGVLWMAGIAAYGAGATKLGSLGKSLGWAILMSAMVFVANLLGIATGEWKGAPRFALQRLAAGILLLLVAIGGLAFVNARL